MDEKVIEELARGINAGFPQLDRQTREIALATHRELAQGSPSSFQAIGEAAGAPRVTVEKALRAWPGVFLDDEEKVIGFWGLALGEMPHRLRIDDRRLFAWCAWDALFLPEILKTPATVESKCAKTGQRISMLVSGKGVEGLDPKQAMVSMVDASGWQGISGNSVISSCCHQINFFADRSLGLDWIQEQRRDDLLLLTVREAHHLGRIANRLRYAWT